MPAIFISHQKDDHQIADDLKAALDRRFEKVFLDFAESTGIEGGENWEKRLYSEISRCHAVVLVLTPKWLESKWCFAELTYARALGKVIVPIICQPVGDHIILPEIQSVNLVPWNEGGLARLEERLRSITNELARGFRLDPRRPPYPGIHAFDAQDAAIYFGRDEETRAVIERLDSHRTHGGIRCLVIIGASGSGKSSLLRAGVLPQLAQRKDQWAVLPPIRPEKAPVEALAKSIAKQIGKEDDWRAWREKLGSAVAIDHIKELLADLRVGEARTATVILPIDQFEEIFTIATQVERDTFLNLLTAALDPASDLPVIVVATGRSDVLEGLLESGALARFTETSPLVPMPLDRVPLLVKGPAGVAGLNVDDGLAEHIARDVERSEALPLLAHTLWLLYRRGMSRKALTLADYEALGDREHSLNPLQNSVRRSADQALNRLRPSEAELTALRDAFVPHLVRVRLDDGKRVRRPARMSELPEQSRGLVRALVETRLLTTRATGDPAPAREGDETLVEVAHEALFGAWPTLDQWLTEEHAFLSDIARIKSAHEIWTQASADQRERALLSGLLLSRSRDWLAKYPQRFLSGDMAELRAFIEASATAADAELARAQAQEARTRRMERMLLRGAVVAATITAVFALLAVWQWRGSEIQRDEALIAQSRFLARDARVLRRNGDVTLATLLALNGLPRALDNPERPFIKDAEYALEDAVANRRDRLVLDGHTGPLTAVAYSPDGQRVLTAARDNTAQLWDAGSGQRIEVLKGHDGEITSGAFSPDGSKIVTGSADAAARVWDGKTGRALSSLRGHLKTVRSVAFSRDGTRIATASDDGTARLWDAGSGAVLMVLRAHHGPVNSVAFSPDGARLVTAAWNKSAELWEVASGRLVAPLRGHEDTVWSANFSPDGKRIVTASRDGTARLWDGETGAMTALLQGHEGQVTSAVFSPDGRHVLTASDDKTARLWDARSGAAGKVLKGQDDALSAAVFSPDGHHIVTASVDKTARLWAADGTPIAILAGHGDWVSAAAFSPDSTQVATASHDHGARVWTVEAAAADGVLRGHTNYVYFASFSPDASIVVTASADNTGRLWNAKTGAPIAVLRGHKDELRSAAFSPDGRQIVTAAEDKTIRIWDVATGRELLTLEGHTSAVTSAAFSSDGTRIVSSSRDRTARVWDAATGRLRVEVAGHTDRVNSAAFSPDGGRFVTASDDATARIWDARTGDPVMVLRGHTDKVRSATYSPEGARILTASADGTARVWEASTGATLVVLGGSDSELLSAAFSPDGKRVVTALWDGQVRLWDARTGALIAVLHGHSDTVWSARFSADGNRLITASEDMTARLWRLPPRCQNLIDTAREGTPRELSAQERARYFLADAAPDARSAGRGMLRAWLAFMLPRAGDTCE